MAYISMPTRCKANIIISLVACLLLLYLFLIHLNLVDTKFYFTNSNNWITIGNLNLTSESQRADSESNTTREALLNNVRIFCIILTTPQSYKSGQAFTVLNTWAYKCDNYRFVTKLPPKLVDLRVSSLSLEIGEPLNILEPSGLLVDTYKQLTLKVFTSIVDIYKKYANSYDWFLKADMDTFIHVNNLREFLKDKDPQIPATYGYDYKVIVENGYHSGGAGYVLSGGAFQDLGEKLSSNMSFCPNTGTEDVDVQSCLRKLGILPQKSVDDLGRERFHMIDLKDSFTGNFRAGMDSYAANPLQKGYNCCSDSFISFHYISGKSMTRLATIINRHEELYRMRMEVERPTFKTVCDEYMLMERVEEEMSKASP